MARVKSLWRNLVHRDRVERDLDDELQATRRLLVEKSQGGVRPAEARRIAMLEIGGMEAVVIEEFMRDLRHSARLLRRNPLFALTAALSLAIGIGANTTVFTVANALLFRAPAGVADPDGLVDIGRTRSLDPKKCE